MTWYILMVELLGMAHRVTSSRNWTFTVVGHSFEENACFPLNGFILTTECKLNKNYQACCDQLKLLFCKTTDSMKGNNG